MFKLIGKAKKNQKGFTLVELMVVVVIIGILVAIAVPLYQGAQDAAKTGAGEANIRILNGGIVQYTAQFGAAPADQAALLAFLSLPGSDFKYVAAGSFPTYTVDITNDAGI